MCEIGFRVVDDGLEHMEDNFVVFLVAKVMGEVLPELEGK